MFDWVIALAFGALLLAIVLAFLRLTLGPSLPDRVVALDMISVLTIGFLAVFAVAADEPAFLDAAITLALVSFLATIAFARYIEQSAAKRREAERSRTS